MDKIKTALNSLGSAWKEIWLVTAIVIGTTILFSDPTVVMASSIVVSIVSFLLGTLFKGKY